MICFTNLFYVSETFFGASCVWSDLHIGFVTVRLGESQKQSAVTGVILSTIILVMRVRASDVLRSKHRAGADWSFRRNTEAYDSQDTDPATSSPVLWV